MDRSSKRGKIPQQDWPAIMARYEAGETLASIARTYDCSPPAISYIVSRSRTRGVAPSAVGSRAPASEPQLIKSHEIETPFREFGPDEVASEQIPAGQLGSPQQRGEEASSQAAPSSPEGLPEQAGSERDDVNEENDVDAARSSEPIGGSSRDHGAQRTLHLSHPHRQDEPPATEPHHHSAHGANYSDELMTSPLARGHRDLGPSDGQEAIRHTQPGNGADARFLREPHSNKEAGAFIDLALRQRVEGDIAAFLAAFDAALNRDTPETRAELRQATDRLLRAGARTRIELERLEARVPLPPRNSDRQPESAWRQR